MSVLDDALLEEWMAGFYGYGRFEAPYWFIGPGEGGCKSSDDVAIRLTAWRARGKRDESMSCCPGATSRLPAPFTTIRRRTPACGRAASSARATSTTTSGCWSTAGPTALTTASCPATSRAAASGGSRR